MAFTAQAPKEPRLPRTPYGVVADDYHLIHAYGFIDEQGTDYQLSAFDVAAARNSGALCAGIVKNPQLAGDIQAMYESQYVPQSIPLGVSPASKYHVPGGTGSSLASGERADYARMTTLSRAAWTYAHVWLQDPSVTKLCVPKSVYLLNGYLFLYVHMIDTKMCEQHMRQISTKRQTKNIEKDIRTVEKFFQSVNVPYELEV